MTSEIYFPEHRHMIGVSLIQRDRTLPDGVDGKTERPKNARVSVKDVVARGNRPAPYVVVDAARELRLRRPERLARKLVVDVGETVQRGQLLAGKLGRRGRPRKGKSVISPENGTVINIGGGLIVIQETQESVAIESGLNGTIIAVSDRHGVVIETYAAVLQGVWGNGKRGLGVLRVEPTDGLESIYGDSVNDQFRGAIVFSRRSLKATTLDIIDSQGFAGVIAPSMDANLIDDAKNTRAAIMLTDGFGAGRINPSFFQFLSEMDGKQVMLDAVTPSTEMLNRPEAIITVPLTGSERPVSMNTNILLRAGMTVNVVRGDGTTVTGRVNDLPNTPVMLDNGLRVAGAVVQLATGETLNVPLANLEVYG